MTDARLEIAAGFATAQGPKADNQDFGGVPHRHGGRAARAWGGGGDRRRGVGVKGRADGGGTDHAQLHRRLSGSEPAERHRRQRDQGAEGVQPLAPRQGTQRPGDGGGGDHLRPPWFCADARPRPCTSATAAPGHFRDGVLTRLTEDHTRAQQGLSHVLYRAVGIEADVKLDVRQVRLEPHDRLLLTTDGVHGVLTDAVIAGLLARRGSPDADAHAILAEVEAAGARDNATAIVIDVVRTGAPDWEAITAEAEGLAIAPPPEVGQTVDGFRAAAAGGGRALYAGCSWPRDMLGDAGVVVLEVSQARRGLRARRPDRLPARSLHRPAHRQPPCRQGADAGRRASEPPLHRPALPCRSDPARAAGGGGAVRDRRGDRRGLAPVSRRLGPAPGGGDAPRHQAGQCDPGGERRAGNWSI